MNVGIGVDKDPLGGKPLGAVAGDGVAVIEVAMLRGVELDLPVVIEPCSNSSAGRNGFDNGKVTVGDGEQFIRGRELNSVANREFMGNFTVDTDTSEAARVVCGGFA